MRRGQRGGKRNNYVEYNKKFRYEKSITIIIDRRRIPFITFIINGSESSSSKWRQWSWK
jgi:hypothetical protein